PMTAHTRHLHSFPTRRSSDLRHALRRELAMQFVETRNLLNARHAPRGPEIQHHHLAAETFRIQVGSVQRLDGGYTRARCRRWSRDRKSTRLNSSHQIISYAVF